MTLLELDIPTLIADAQADFWERVLEDAGLGELEIDSEPTISLDDLDGDDGQDFYESLEDEYDPDGNYTGSYPARTFHGYDEGCMDESPGDRRWFAAAVHDTEVRRAKEKRPTENDVLYAMIVGFQRYKYSFPMPYYYSGTDRRAYYKRTKKHGFKTCAECGMTKLLKEFSDDKRNRDGKHSYCKSCRKKAARKRRLSKRTKRDVT